MKKYFVSGLFLVTSFAFTSLNVSAQTYSSSSAKLTASSTCVSLTKNLSKGQENSEVLALQQFLFDGGYLTTKPNGYFGAGTVTAVKRFQIANSMSPVGSVGSGTRAKVKEMSCRKVETQNTSTTTLPFVVSVKNKERAQELTGGERATLDMEKRGYVKTPFSLKESVIFSEEVSKRFEKSSEQAIDYSGILFANKKSTDGLSDYKFRVDIKNVQKEGIGGIGIVNISCDPGIEFKMVYTGDLCSAKSRIDLAGTAFTFHDNVGGGSLNFITKGKGKIYFEFVVSLPTGESSGASKIKVLPTVVLHKGVTFDIKEAIDPTENELVVERNNKRQKDIQSFVLAIDQYLQNNGGKLPTSVTSVPKETCVSQNYSCDGMIEPWLSPMYFPLMPVEYGATKKNGSGYVVSRSGITVTVSSQYAEGGKVITKSFDFKNLK